MPVSMNLVATMEYQDTNRPLVLVAILSHAVHELFERHVDGGGEVLRNGMYVWERSTELDSHLLSLPSNKAIAHRALRCINQN